MPGFSLKQWTRKLFFKRKRRANAIQSRSRKCPRLHLEELEHRWVPSLMALATFTGTNGATSTAGLVEDSHGNLFGVTGSGGASGFGTVFEVASGSGTITTIATFNGANGANPCAGLIEDSSGNLFGTAYQGGANGAGTVFEVIAGSGTITTLATFNGTNGANPCAGLVEDSSGNLFGTTQAGGASNDGTVFEVLAGSGAVTTLAAFNGANGSGPSAGLIEDSNGNLFGTTASGGASSDGTVFEIVAGSGSITTLASFNGTNGAEPYAGLIEDSSGNLFGTAFDGGASAYGTVFEIATGSNTITALASFSGTNGANPKAGLVEDGSGDLFGATSAGGDSGDGAVFEVPAGSGTITTLASYDGTNTGAVPCSSPLMDARGNFIGTTAQGGASNDGTVFEYSPTATSVEASPQTATFSTSSQQVTLSATVTASDSSSVNGGTITFGVYNGTTQVGTSVISSAVASGVATAGFTLPAGTPAGIYSIHVSYSGYGKDGGSSNAGDSAYPALTVVAATTSVEATAQSAEFSVSDQAITLSALVSSSTGANANQVNEGVVVFSVYDGTSQIGSSVTSGTVVNGTASAAYTLPGGTPIGTYSIHVSFAATADYGYSDNSGDTTFPALTVTLANTTVDAYSQYAVFSSSNEAVVLFAYVNDDTGDDLSVGTVTFGIFAGSTQIGTSITSPTVESGAAVATFTLPANTPAGIYNIHVSYSGGGNFKSSDNSGDTAFPTLTVSSDPPQTFYVSTTGDDNNSGSAAAPFATLQHAMLALQPGDTLDVEAGSYTGFIVGWDTQPASSGDQYGAIDGTSSFPITIQADPLALPGSVIINTQDDKTRFGIDLEPFCDYVTLVGITVADSGGITSADSGGGGIKIAGDYDAAISDTITGITRGQGIIADNATSVMLENNTITGTGNQGNPNLGHGIYLSGTLDRAVVVGNRIYNNAYIGIHVNGDASEGGAGLVTNALIADNYIYNNGQNGINCDGLQDSSIENNLIYGYQSFGIALYQIDASAGSENNIIVNNTIVSTVTGSGAALRILDGSTGNTLLNNVLLGGGGVALRISSDSMSGLVSDYNISGGIYQSEDTGGTQPFVQWQASTGQDTHSIIASATQLFVNASSNNYQLSPTSPAINAGTATDAPGTDILGYPRPSGGGFDIGAYQTNQLTVGPAALAVAVVSSSYNATISATGGSGPYTFAIYSGSLPAGLGLNSASGVLSGVPTASGAYTFTIVATDSSNPALVGSRTYTLTVYQTGSIVANGQAGYSESGSGWASYSDPNAYNGDERYAAAGTGANTAAWQVPYLEPGIYNVELTWTAFPNRATNASYEVFDGAILLATVLVNQQLVPSGGATANGTPFQSLGSFIINSGTLEVVLSDNANGYVVANAIDVVQSSLPEVVDNSQFGYSDAGGGWTSFGDPNAYVGNERYTAPGTGSNTATWQAIGLAPGAYDVQVDWTAFANRATNATYQIFDGATLLGTATVDQTAPATGGATINGITFQSLGRFTINSGTLKVVLSDNANGYVIADAMLVEVATLPVVIDNGQGGYSDAGAGWASFNDPNAYLGNERYVAPGTGSNTATWQTSSLPSGAYNVYVDWTPFAGRATNATYQIFDGATLLATTSIDQTQAPSGDVVLNGIPFQSLGRFPITSGTVKVVLSDNANGYVIADAMYVQAATGPVVVDNGKYGYAETGTGWTSFSDPNAYNGNERYAAPGAGANTATWSVPGLTAGTYNVQVDWTPFANRATNATYQIFDGATLLATTSIDQTQSPNGGVVLNGTPFQSLGRFPIASGTVKVVLSDNANGYVIADAMYVTVWTGPVVVDNGQYGYAETGTGWTSFSDPNAYNGNERYVASGVGANTATWSVPDLTAGTYNVQVNWTAYANRATNATYQVFDGATLLGTVTVNQQVAPTGGSTVNGVAFQSLGQFLISGGTLRVVLTDNADGYVIADAIVAI
jgi:uncharacterized repeat protein (TIGR03803 family)